MEEKSDGLIDNADVLMPEWYELSWFSKTTLNGFEFENPHYFWLLLAIPVLIALRWLVVQLYRSRLGVATFKGNVGWSWSVLLKVLPDTFLCLFWAMLVIALARPQRSDEQVERWTEGIDILLILDTSGSMELQDFKPNRLESAKKVATKFIDGRLQDRIGLVVFAEDAYSLSPLTTDYDLLFGLIKNNIKLKMMADAGTAIGSALAVGINHMKDSEAKTKIMILLSDGENNAGNIDPKTAAQLAYGYGIKIYSIGIGKDGKVPYGKNFLGMTNYVESNLDETSLREIADIGKGEFFRASNSKALEKIFEKIDEYEKSEIKENRYKNTQDYYQIYLYWALTFFTLWLLLKGTFISNALED